MFLESVAADLYSISNVSAGKQKEKMLHKRDLSIMFWEQVLPMLAGLTAQTMTILA